MLSSNVIRKFKAALLLLSALLGACATPSETWSVAQCPRTPWPGPMLMKPVSPEVLLNSAQSDIDGWTEKLKSSAAK